MPLALIKYTKGYSVKTPNAQLRMPNRYRRARRVLGGGGLLNSDRKGGRAKLKKEASLEIESGGGGFVRGKSVLLIIGNLDRKIRGSVGPGVKEE
jgi:hypothetical protein